MKNLWSLLSGSLSLKSLQFIADELEQNQDQLINGILYFQQFDSRKNTIEELSKNKNVIIITPRVLHNLSLFLDLEAQQCQQLFQSYLLYEYKGTPEMIKSIFTNDKQLRDLFENMWNFYYSERIFTLFNIKQIMSNWQASDHIYKTLFQDFVKHVNIENILFTKLCAQLKYVTNFKFDCKSKYGQYFNDLFLDKLKENIHKEKAEILQVLILYLKNFKPSIENVHEILSLLNTYVISSKDVLVTSELYSFIMFIRTILMVETFDIGNLYKCFVEDTKHYLFIPENGNRIEDIQSMISKLDTSKPEHSLVFMSWLVVFNLTKDSLVCLASSNDYEKMGLLALQLKLFNYLNQSLSHPFMSYLKGSVVYNSIFEIVGNVLGAVLTLFDYDKLLHTEPSLKQLLVHMFSNETISKMVYEHSLATGLGLSIRHCLDMFPFKTHFLFSLLDSLAETKNCKLIFERMNILNLLTSYTDEIDLSTNSISRLPSHDGLVVRLEHDLLLYDGKIFIPKETIGRSYHINSNQVVQWQETNLNGWKIVFYRLTFLIDQIKRGRMTCVNHEIVLNELSKIASICSSLIDHNAYSHISNFKEIIDLLLSSFKLIVGLSQVSIRLYIASIIQLSVSLMKNGQLSHDQVWFVLTQKEFFPYLLGFSKKFDEMLEGKDTNVSTFGYIMSSEECIKGSYELTLAFLKLFAYFSEKSLFLSESHTIASFILIIREIFPSHKLWNYKRSNDANRIGFWCIQVFHNILNGARKKTKLELIEKICIVALMEGSSAERLLLIIRHGEQVVKDKIVSSGNECLLMEDEQIITLRLSLQILNYLLDVYTPVAESLGRNKKSALEDMIFSSTVSSHLNLLLTFTGFAFQKYDIHLATNATQLLSQLAVKFPMSMLACFGTNTEYIRDHLLFRLETVTEDINFKIALLKFLSNCIQHQLGLVEMFLNVPNNQRGMLGSILEILGDKLEGHYFCPLELLQASLDLIAQFWLKTNIIAMDLLKSNTDFWKLVTFPIFIEKDEDYNYLLCSSVLKIISREVFYCKTLER